MCRGTWCCYEILWLMGGKSVEYNDLRPHKFHPCARMKVKYRLYALKYAACLLSHCVITSCDLLQCSALASSLLCFTNICSECRLSQLKVVMRWFSVYGNYNLWICVVPVCWSIWIALAQISPTLDSIQPKDGVSKWNSSTLSHVQPIIVKWVPSASHYRNLPTLLFLFFIFFSNVQLSSSNLLTHSAYYAREFVGKFALILSVLRKMAKDMLKKEATDPMNNDCNVTLVTQVSNYNFLKCQTNSV